MFISESQTNDKAQDVSHTKCKKLPSGPFRIKTGDGLYFCTVCTKIYISIFEKSISLGLIAFPVKTLRSWVFHDAVTKHLSYYFVRPSNLSVTIHTAFLKFNPFFSKAHNSWKRSTVKRDIVIQGQKYSIYVPYSLVFVWPYIIDINDINTN